MSSKYLYSELKRGEFRVDFSGVIVGASIENSIKIDTGAMRSLFPLKTLNYIDYADIEVDELTDEIRDSFYKLIKLQFLDAGYTYSFLRGIERYKSEIGKPLRERRDLVFYDSVFKINLGGYSVGRLSNVAISCDTDGNCLLGMDVLKDFDFHIGTSRVTGKCTFIGCLRDSISSEYLNALDEHFGLKPESYYNAIDWRNYLSRGKGIFSQFRKGF